MIAKIIVIAIFVAAAAICLGVGFYKSRKKIEAMEDKAKSEINQGKQAAGAVKDAVDQVKKTL